MKFQVGQEVAVTQFFGRIVAAEETGKGVRYTVRYQYPDGHTEWACLYGDSLCTVMNEKEVTNEKDVQGGGL